MGGWGGTSTISVVKRQNREEEEEKPTLTQNLVEHLNPNHEGNIIYPGRRNKATWVRESGGRAKGRSLKAVAVLPVGTMTDMECYQVDKVHVVTTTV